MTDLSRWPLCLLITSLAFLAAACPESGGDDPVDMAADGADSSVDIELDTSTFDAQADGDVEDMADMPRVFSNEIATGVFELAGSDPTLSSEDLAAFGAMVGDVQVVSLGESVHLSGGYLQIKDRLMRYLIEVHGVRVVAFETEWTRADIVSAYLQSDCSERPEDVVRAGIRATWHDQSVANLIGWMCAFNLANPDDPVDFFGFNNFQPWDDAPVLADFVDTYMPTEADTLKADMDLCEGVIYADEETYFMNHPRQEPVLTADYEACMGALDAIEAGIVSNEAALIADAGEEALRWLRLHLLSLQSWEAYRYGSNPEGLMPPEDLPALVEALRVANNERDAAMAEIFLTVRALRHPDAKVVFSSHNFHNIVGSDTLDNVYPDITAMLDYREGTQRMGYHLDAQLGEDYAAIGLLGYNVGSGLSYLGIVPDELDDLPAGAETIELLLHALGRDVLLLDLERATTGDSPFLQADTLYRTITPDNIMGMTVLLFFEAIPRDLYRGVIFLEDAAPWDILEP